MRVCVALVPFDHFCMLQLKQLKQLKQVKQMKQTPGLALFKKPASESGLVGATSESMNRQKKVSDRSWVLQDPSGVSAAASNR